MNRDKRQRQRRAQRSLLHRAGISSAVVALATFASVSAAFAQSQGGNDPMQPGEAFVTRFSGTKALESGTTVIDPQGTVGSIIDVRNPGQPPKGAHWIDEPQRTPITAAQIGQVFGVALDNATPPNIYVAATPAFGLHLAPGTRSWMDGMWGAGGGPGTVYVLDARNGYQPRPFADIRLNGRPNTGASLGNIAFDRVNQQLFVTDLETGMIHRISLRDGRDLGYYDHGTQGRERFFDAMSGKEASLPAIAFDEQSQARIENCDKGEFSQTPECWNLAASGRRVWGVGVRHDTAADKVRVFYAAWSAPTFGEKQAWDAMSEDDKRNSVWSIGLKKNGDFDFSDVRREFVMPDFFVDQQDIARAGYSQPVSDITFSNCGERPIMLVAERGGIRNLGLDADEAFAYPHEARALRYELDQTGAWRPVGRYDVGFYDRANDRQPFLRANCAGGVTFGPGYNLEQGTVDLAKLDGFVWMTGHKLCSPEGPCNLPGNGAQAQAGGQQGGDPTVQPAADENGGNPGGADDSHVHGTQGLDANAFEEIAPEGAYKPYSGNEAYPAHGLNQSYLIDTDINVDENGGPIEDEFLRNDATRIGDIAIYQICEPKAVGVPLKATFLLPPPPPIDTPPPTIVGHPRDVSHAQVASHGRQSSHYRWGSHSRYWSHNRWGSHNSYWSHTRTASHDRYYSHYRWGSHNRRASHNRSRSHNRVFSHWRLGSHNRRWSHQRYRSHSTWASHNRSGSHSSRVSHTRLWSHNTRLSHVRIGSHNRSFSHVRTASHTTTLSHGRHGSHSGTVSHNRLGSHLRVRSHTTFGSHGVARSHSRLKSHVRSISKIGDHNRIRSHSRTGSHNRALSNVTKHSVARSHARSGSHLRSLSRTTTPGIIGVHNVSRSHARSGSHNRVLSQGKVKVPHATAQSHARRGSHNARVSLGKVKPVHSVFRSKGDVKGPGKHLPTLSHARRGSHNAILSKGKVKPIHNATISRVKDRPIHNQVISRGKVKTPVHNATISRVKNRPVHNPVVSRGKVKPIHNATISRAKNRPVHNQILSKGKVKTPIVRPPVVKQPIVKRPPPQKKVIIKRPPPQKKVIIKRPPPQKKVIIKRPPPQKKVIIKRPPPQRKVIKRPPPQRKVIQRQPPRRNIQKRRVPPRRVQKRVINRRPVQRRVIRQAPQKRVIRRQLKNR